MRAASRALLTLAGKMENAASWLDMARGGEVFLPGQWRLMSQRAYDRMEREQWDMALEREHQLLTRTS